MTLTALIRKWEKQKRLTQCAAFVLRNNGRTGPAMNADADVIRYEEFLRDLRSLQKPKRTKKGERV